MSAAKKKIALYIGRFSLFHNGHAEVLKRALQLYENVLVIVGSAKRPRTPKNPWTAQERADLINEWYKVEFGKNQTLGRLVIATSRDFMYNNQKWLIETQKIIKQNMELLKLPSTEPVWITGSNRDDTSFYLNMFPSPSFELDLVEENQDVSRALSATWCRELYFARTFNGQQLDDKHYDLLIRAFVPNTTLQFLNKFQETEAYKELLAEHYVVTKRREGANQGPYPRIDVTVDNIVIQSGHILLIKRRSHPGKGLWALPGGYLEPREWTIDGAIRELDEETKIKVAPGVLRRAIVADRWFEHPDRSLINRVITHTFCYKLPDWKVDGRVTLPGIKGSDDAEKAKFFTLEEALSMSDKLFDDHFDQIEEMVDDLR